MSSYVLRSYCFGYNDENFYVCGWQVGEIFSDKEKAEVSYRELQLAYLRQLDLSEHESVFNGDQKYLQKIDRYLHEKTGKNVLEGDYVDSQRELHTELSDDDLFAFGEFADMRAYKLIEFDDEPVFYALFDPREDEYVKYYDESFEGPVYGNSQDEINELIAEYAEDMDWEAHGSVQELSDNPVLLQQLIDSSKGIKYENSEKRLYLDDPNVSNVAAVNDLLRKPIFEIREMNTQAIKQLENEMMEDMY